MEVWKEYRLGDVVDFNPKRTIKKGTKARKISMENLEIFSRDIHSFSYDFFKGGSKFINGDSIIARITPCLENGKQAFISLLDKDEVAFGSTEFIVLRGIDGITDNRFVYYFMNTEDFRNTAVKSMVGSSGRQRVQNDFLKNLFIKLPNIECQQRIADILSLFDDKIEVNRKINENLEQQAQALFKSWFVDFEPFKDGKFVDSELGMIPEGWKVGNIYKYINVIYGAPYKSALFNSEKNGLPLIRIRDLKTFSPQFYTPEILPNTEYINMGDVVAGMDAEFTPCLWLGNKGVLNQRCCKFTAKEEGISNYYILYLTKPELEYVQSYKTGTTVSHLGKSDIDRFKVINPPLEIIKGFSLIVNSILKRKLRLSEEIINLTNLRDTLLPKLMSGEIEI